tara:strand:- start:78 stop:578 length:501 start_codon:yes stop_codon:yes gene_type:complete
MSYYYNPTKTELKTWSQIKVDYPNTSFPNEPNTALVNDLGFEEVIFPTKPTPSSNLKIIVEDGVKEEADGWTLVYKEIDLHSDTTDSEGNVTTKASKDEKFLQKVDENKQERMRNIRNSMLTETDFYALSDVTMSDSMKTYRQALRDLSTHSNWPNITESDWPTKP